MLSQTLVVTLTVMAIIFIPKYFISIKNYTIFTLTSLYEYFITNGLHFRRRCKCDARLDGKIVVITGGNTGIGKETALQLSLRGAQVIIGCRDQTKGQSAVNDIKERNPLAIIKLKKLDLSSLSSIRHFVKDIEDDVPNIDILINNAGIMMCPEWQTEDGFEMQLGTNYLGHFLLIHLLMPLLKKSQKSRIINVSSVCHILGSINFDNINLKNGSYRPMKAYAQSKLALILLTRELAKRLGADNSVKVYCLHPGVIRTEITRHFPLWLYYLICNFMTSIELGAQTTIHCALDPELDKESGYYYDDCHRVNRMISQARDDRSADRLYELSCQLVKLEQHLKINRHVKF